MVREFWEKKTDDSEVNGFDERHLDVRSFYVGLSSFNEILPEQDSRSFQIEWLKIRGIRIW